MTGCRGGRASSLHHAFTLTPEKVMFLACSPLSMGAGGGDSGVATAGIGGGAGCRGGRGLAASREGGGGERGRGGAGPAGTCENQAAGTTAAGASAMATSMTRPARPLACV